MNKTTACPLDCYDACGIRYEEGKIKPITEGFTQGFLCAHMNRFEEHERILQPRYKGDAIDLGTALKKLKEILANTQKNKILHYRGNGNFALMQEVSEHFFASYGAILTEGSLCDGAGHAGILEGRGSNRLHMPLEEIAKAETVVLWGRNPHATSSHLLPLLEGKKLIVIDPIKTKAAKKADLHIQIKPHGDLHLAMLLSRFLHIENGCDTDFLEKYAPEYEEFYELTQTIRIKATLEQIDVTLGQIGSFLELVRGKKTAIVCGVGIQKYKDGGDIMRSIDAFAAMLGLFGKEGCGVAYLADSKEGILSPFYTKSAKVSKVNTEFAKFKTLFIQGANPLAQMPDTKRVVESMQHVENVIYFGLYENETSQRADLVIPAKTFLAKNDIRASYACDVLHPMPKQREEAEGISEYELSAFLCEAFGIEIKSEAAYLEHFKNHGVQRLDGLWHVEKKMMGEFCGFDTDEGTFVFLDEIESDFDMEEKLFLLTPKSPKSLNSMFRREAYAYLNAKLGLNEGEEVLISSQNGSVKLRVKLDDDVREDCVLIYSGTCGVNNLTSSKHAYGGKFAIYQENKVEVQKI